ncbi:MAG: hypothetical protein ABS61_05510 [Microbacterium sp. SCN 70-18]|nr:MAG: hypothetical protein ABS61_05510 [Microbacterium sp. SCN 70-18]
MRDRGAQFPHFSKCFHALGRDAVSVLVNVGCRVQLPRRRYAQVEHRLRDSDDAVFAGCRRRRGEQPFKPVE